MSRLKHRQEVVLILKNTPAVLNEKLNYYTKPENLAKYSEKSQKQLAISPKNLYLLTNL